MEGTKIWIEIADFLTDKQKAVEYVKLNELLVETIKEGDVKKQGEKIQQVIKGNDNVKVLKLGIEENTLKAMKD